MKCMHRVGRILTWISAQLFRRCTLSTNVSAVAGGILQRTLAGRLIPILEHEPHVAAEIEYAFNSTGAHAWATGAVPRAVALVKSGAGQR